MTKAFLTLMAVMLGLAAPLAAKLAPLPQPLSPTVEAVAQPTPDERTLPVICYHRFGEEDDFDELKISGKRFAQELAWLKRAGYHSVTLEQARDFLAGKGEDLPAHPIILSIDDAYKSGWTVAGPIMKHYGFKAVYFLISSQVSAGRNFLSWPEVRDLLAAGHQIGSHTMHHSNLAKPAKGETPEKYAERLQWELTQSRSFLEEKLGFPVKNLAYPFGAYNPVVTRAAIKAGYDLIFTVTGGANMVGDDPHRVHRFILMGHPSLDSFKKKVMEQRLRANIQGLDEGCGFYTSQLPDKVVITLPSAVSESAQVEPPRVDLQGEWTTVVPGVAPGTWAVTLDKKLKNSFYYLKVETGDEEHIKRDTYLFQVYPDRWKPWFEPLQEPHDDTLKQ